MDQMTCKIIDNLSQKKNQQKLCQTIEQLMTDRFMWIIRCFELISVLAIIQTLMLAYLIFKVHSSGTAH